MGLGKPQLHAKFAVAAGFMFYENIKESVFDHKFAL